MRLEQKRKRSASRDGPRAALEQAQSGAGSHALARAARAERYGECVSREGERSDVNGAERSLPGDADVEGIEIARRAKLMLQHDGPEGLVQLLQQSDCAPNAGRGSVQDEGRGARVECYDTLVAEGGLGDCYELARGPVLDAIELDIRCGTSDVGQREPANQ